MKLLAFDQVEGWFYWFTYVMTWVLPLVGLGLGIREKDRALLDVSLVMALATLVTNKAVPGLAAAHLGSDSARRLADGDRARPSSVVVERPWRRTVRIHSIPPSHQRQRDSLGAQGDIGRISAGRVPSPRPDPIRRVLTAAAPAGLEAAPRFESA